FTYTITHNGTSASANLVLSLGEGTSSDARSVSAVVVRLEPPAGQQLGIGDQVCSFLSFVCRLVSAQNPSDSESKLKIVSVSSPKHLRRCKVKPHGSLVS
ncbi:hypothetical protein, partial [Enterobacter hormaechei]|uniref:hypothetical protein n=1 Tax=Enterobacter hormaechei TaxID=158836 RepID=UPI002876BBA0